MRHVRRLVLKSTLAVVLGAAGSLAGLGIAHADSIDGHWCSDAGKRIIIEGPAVTTPAGVRMQGNYSRHGFAFTMPANEADGGAAIDMVLQGEQRVSVRIGVAAPQLWRRCAAGVS